MPYGIKQEIIDKLNGVFARNPNINEVILYGSRAKGDYRTGSDIDLALKGDKINLKQINKLNNEIDELLLPYKIDISILNQISNPDLIDHINRVGKLFYKQMSRERPTQPNNL